MRILFINFNIGSTPGLNNGLAVLSAVMKRNKHDVRLIFLCEELGYGLDLERIKKDIIDFTPDIIGISLMETQLKYAGVFLKEVRRYYNGFVICGGPYPTMDPEGCLSLGGVDAVCIGEGEGALAELSDALSTRRDYKGIRNLWLKSSDKTIIKNKLRPFIDLNVLPPEDKELFDLDKILPLKNYQLEMTLGRGCIYQCSYCINQSYLKRYQSLCESAVSVREYVRMKNVNVAVKEIKDAVSLHPQIKKIAFIDDNFLMYDDFLRDFCESYRRQIRLPFMCNVNPLSYSTSKASALKEAGCDDVRFGVESGSERLKKDILKRPIPNWKVIEAFKINRACGLMTSSFNMIGLPTETKEEVFETLRLNSEIMPETVKVMTFYPFKNTPIYDLCEQLDLIDYKKKHELDNYDTFTCLKFTPEHRLFLKKIQTTFSWRLNLFLNNDASSKYGRLINDIEKMDEEEWGRFDFEAVDKELSEEFMRKGVIHYSKHTNRSLAVKFPSKHVLSGKLARERV